MVTAHDGCGSFRPVCVAQWDIVDPFPAIELDEAGDQGGAPVHLLVRLGTEPLGYSDFESEDTGSLPNAAAVSASKSFLSQINARLAKSGLPLISEIPADGLRLDPNQLAFVAEREHLLENAPDISVVLCTRDRPARVADCVRGLARQEYPSYEIIVVDNAPADRGAVPAVLASLDLHVPVRYVLEARGGTSWARNAGWRAAKADIIAFTDDDAVPDRYWLAEIVRGFSARSRVGCVTGMVLPAELRTEPQQWFEELAGLSQLRGFNQEIFGPGHSQSPLYPFPEFGAGVNMAFRREVLVDIGGFHVALGAGTPAMGCEDTFAFTRTLLAQHTVVYQPTALVFHYHRETLADLKKQLHGYSISTTAFYAALIAYQPKLLLAILRLVPTAYIRDQWREKDSTRAARLRTSGPTRTRALGWLAGVPAYVRSVRKQRRIAGADPTQC
jgi:O-antigen biosynthesis protein